MKIIHIITAFGIGGAEKLLLNVINKQVDEHDIHLIYLKPIDDLISFVDERVTIKQFPLSISTIRKLKKYYTNQNPDIIHTHLGHADLLGIWSARKMEVKIFTTIHSTSFSGNNFRDAIYFNLYRFIGKKVLHKWYIISISKVVKRAVTKKIKILKDKNYLLYNAIPDVKFSDVNRKLSKKVSLLFLGRLTKAKSINTLLKAVKYLKNKKTSNSFDLKIVGDGSLRKSLEQLTLDLQIENNVKFIGKQQNVNTSYEQADIFILPSIWEGFGIVILEAFRAKTAVIASNIEGPSELIKHKENGLLFEPLNHIQLAEQIELLINDNSLREKIAQKGYDTFTEKYHIDTYVKKLNELYLNA